MAETDRPERAEPTTLADILDETDQPSDLSNVVTLPALGSSDFVEGFMELTAGAASPEIYRLWCGIAAVAAALERRVWIETGRGVMFPNLYVMLVGAPGVGKDQSMNYVERLFEAVPRLTMAPHSMTAASMLDDFEHAKRMFVQDGKLLAEYHSMLVLANEFSVFCPEYDVEFLGRLNYIYDNHNRLRITRKYLKDEVNIKNPQLNILAGAQPGLLAGLPPEAWNSGTMARMIMVYAASGPKISLFNSTEEPAGLFGALRAKLQWLSVQWGKFHWDKEAAKILNEWHLSDGPPKPTHSKLEHYARRRTTLHVLKLSLISAASRTNNQVIGRLDVERAVAWLTQAELYMPDIFREMQGKSDGETIRELHYYMWKLWIKDKKALHESRLVNFLKDRVPHEKIMRLIEISERANVIRRQPGSAAFIPVPSADHGLAE